MKLSYILFAGLFTRGTPNMPTCLDGGCTNDVTLKHQLGSWNGPLVDNWDNLPINIISQDGTTVTFEVSHEWGALELNNFFVQYYSASEGLQTCDHTNNFPDGSCVRITAQCMQGNNVAVVTLTAVDPVILDTSPDNPEIPLDCCAMLDDIPVPSTHFANSFAVKYVFELKCNPGGDCGPAVSNGNCAAAPLQTFVGGILPVSLYADNAGCRFSEECANCCCDSTGVGSVCCAATGDPVCCSYATYTSTFPYGGACP
jgi:hypothetical protein